MKGRIMKEPAIVVPHEADAGGGWSNHRTVVWKVLEKLLAHFLSLIPETAVESHLAAACLVAVEIYGDIKLLEDFNHVHPGFRVNLVHKAGDENID